MERDEDVRTACFASLDVLQAQFGEDIPYKAGLERGFAFRGHRVPFLNYQKGIYRAAVQRGPAALSINTSFRSPYDDEPLEDGFRYAYRAGSIDQADNLALRAAYSLGVPLVYFIGTRPGWYRPFYPYFITGDDPGARQVVVTPGALIGPVDEQVPVLLETSTERRYAVREVRVRLHQARFRGLVLPAYRDQCAICRLREIQLLDAAHIAADVDPMGSPEISNGLSLCTIHHRAYDQDLVGVSPDYTVHVARRLQEDEDGSMLDLLKGSHGAALALPRRKASQPNRELLQVRFDRFRDAA